MKLQTHRRIQLLSIVVISFLLINSGCSRWCARHNPASVHDSISYVEKITYRDTTIKIQGDTMVMFIGGERDTVFIKENSKQKTIFTRKNKTTEITTICKEDSLKLQIKTLEKQKTQITKTVQIQKEPFIPFWIYLLFGALAMVIIFLIIRE